MKCIHLSFSVQFEGSINITIIQFQKISPLGKETCPLSPTPIPSSLFSQPPVPNQLLIYFLSLHVCCVQSRLTLAATLWTVAHQAFLSMGFPRQEYRSRLPFPSSRDLPKPEIESASPELAGRFFTTVPPGKPCIGS